MIIVKDKTQESTITFVSPMSLKLDKYTVLLQNTTTKEVMTFDVLDEGNGIYMKFKIDLSPLNDGEYVAMVFENSNWTPFEIYANDLKESNREVIYYLSDGTTLLKEGDFFLVTSQREYITPLKTDVLRIGEYKRNTTTYRNEQTFIQYNK